MISMMKRVLGFISGLLFPLVYASPVFADDKFNICPADSTFAALCNLNINNAGSFIGNIIVFILIIAIIIAVIFLIYGGIKWIVSGGDKQGVESARNHIIAAIVGLIIALLAFFIVTLVLGLLGINIRSFNIPTLIKQ